MTIIAKNTKDALLDRLAERYDNLTSLLRQARSLTPAQGERYRHPENLCHVDEMDVRLAVADFNSILSEVKKAAK